MEWTDCASCAESIARTITDEHYKVRALTAVAAAVVGRDPERAIRLTDEAELTADAAATELKRADALILVCEAVCDYAPGRIAPLAGRAEEAARATTDLERKPSLLARLGAAVAGHDPAYAARLADQAEQAANLIDDADPPDGRIVRMPGTSAREATLGVVAAIVARHDVDRAERIGRSLTRKSPKTQALHAAALALVGTDPDRAERVAGEIPEPMGQSHAWATLAGSLAGRETGREPGRAARLADQAERTAESMTDDMLKAMTQNAIAKAITPGDLDRAERIADGITNVLKASALVELAVTAAADDPGRAARLADRAEPIVDALIDEGQQTVTVAYIAERLAAFDPDRAERYAQAITGNFLAAHVLAAVAAAVAGFDPQRAARLVNQALRIVSIVGHEEARPQELASVVLALVR
jgi:hypothetical protein